MAATIEDITARRAQCAYKALPHQLRAFVDQYTIDFKVGESAKRVGIKETNASNTGSRWLAMPNVALAIMYVLEEKAKLARIDAAWVLRRAALLADFNIKRFIVVDPESGRPYYDFQSATDDDWYCINEVTVDALRGYVDGESRIAVDRVKLKPFDKLKALELVAKHRDVRAFEMKAEGDGKQSVTEVTRRIVRPGDAQLPAPVKVPND